MLRSALTLVVALGTAAPVLAQSAPTSRRPALLIHGNYCGPGNNAPRPPIDALDAACARHDACTPRGGLPTPSCNARLEREADLIAHDPRQPAELRSMAGLVALGATMIPSEERSMAAGPAPARVGFGMAPAPHLPPALSDADDDAGPDDGEE